MKIPMGAEQPGAPGDYERAPGGGGRSLDFEVHGVDISKRVKFFIAEVVGKSYATLPRGQR